MKGIIVGALFNTFSQGKETVKYGTIHVVKGKANPKEGGFGVEVKAFKAFDAAQCEEIVGALKAAGQPIVANIEVDEASGGQVKISEWEPLGKLSDFDFGLTGVTPKQAPRAPVREQLAAAGVNGAK